MRIVRFAAAIAAVACLTPAATEAASARQKARAQAAPQSHETLYQQCHVAVFRKFGRNSGDGRLMMLTDNLVEQTDYCVRNGGRI
jgi:hypothetical protein